VFLTGLGNNDFLAYLLNCETALLHGLLSNIIAKSNKDCHKIELDELAYITLIQVVTVAAE